MNVETLLLAALGAYVLTRKAAAAPAREYEAVAYVPETADVPLSPREAADQGLMWDWTPDRGWYQKRIE